MKLAYVNGPFRKLAFSRASRSPAVTKSGTLYFPVWLAYAAGWALKSEEFEVELVDAVTRRWSAQETAAALQRQGADIIILDSTTPSIIEDLETARCLREALPEAFIVLVGTHASALPEQTLRSAAWVDAVIRGEYDQVALELARALRGGDSLENVAGLTFRRGEELVFTPAQPLMNDLDALPFVTDIYDRYLRVEDYFFSAARYPMTMTVTSRGCPHRCQWCVYPQVMHRGKYRTRSAENVAAEFAALSMRRPVIREVGVEDDLFTGDRRRLRRICELLIAQRNRLRFWCDTRVDLTYEDMRLLKAAGCRLLIAGFESADQETLDRIGKGARVEQAVGFMADARRANLLVHGCFVMGNPGETSESMQRTLDFAQQLNPDSAQFFPMMVYPGTAMFAWAVENGYLRTQDYRRWLTPEGLHAGVVDLPDLAAREVQRFCDYARREFYLRRGYIWKKMRQSLRNPFEAKRNIRAFCRLARHLAVSS
ncbi:MAG: radical SAM protein [Sedimentisphaerales bacterium]|nr:radical SAM protein [Sedimentisphaerales bacterium]